MTLKTIENNQNKMAKALKTIVHPDNPLAVHINARYRELETLKTQLK